MVFAGGPTVDMQSFSLMMHETITELEAFKSLTHLFYIVRLKNSKNENLILWSFMALNEAQLRMVTVGQPATLSC